MGIQYVDPTSRCLAPSRMFFDADSLGLHTPRSGPTTAGLLGSQGKPYDGQMSKPNTAPVVLRSGWCAGLSFQTGRAVMEAGYQSKAQARAAVMDGTLSPEATVGLGPLRFQELCKWLGVAPQSRKPTEEEVAAAVALLECAGYEVKLTERFPVIDI